MWGGINGIEGKPELSTLNGKARSGGTDVRMIKEPRSSGRSRDVRVGRQLRVWTEMCHIEEDEEVA